MFNNIFADNRAGWAELPLAQNFNTSAIKGIGGPGDPTPIQRWDMGVVGGSDLLAPTNSILNSSATLTNANVAGGYISDPTNRVIDGTIDGASPAGGIGFINPQDFLVDSLMWRNNTNNSYPVLVAHMVPVNLLANYHITDNTSLAFNGGAASNTGGVPSVVTPAPNHDVDNEHRPTLRRLRDRRRRVEGDHG